jgi:hypothetical protein
MTEEPRNRHFTIKECLQQQQTEELSTVVKEMKNGLLDLSQGIEKGDRFIIEIDNGMVISHNLLENNLQERNNNFPICCWILLCCLFLLLFVVYKIK